MSATQAPMTGQTGASGATQTAQTSAQGGEDYMDKGLDAIEKKFGINSSKYRAQNEKVTDGIRGWIEKMTGKKVPAKFSN